MSYFDSRAFRMMMRGVRTGVSQPARVFDWYRHQTHAAPYWTNISLLFGGMFAINIFGRGVERSICKDKLEL